MATRRAHFSKNGGLAAVSCFVPYAAHCAFARLSALQEVYYTTFTKPAFRLWPSPVKGVASAPPGSPFAFARIRQVDKLYHILRAHATPSATWAGARRPFRPSHAARAMRGIPPHLPGPASLFACVHQAGGARSIRPLFHMQPAPAGRTKVRERTSRHQPARRAAPANRPRLYRAIQTRRPAHVIIKVGRHGRPERGKGR